MTMTTLVACSVFFLVLFVATNHDDHHLGVRGDPQVPCFFIFGDSLSDSGNNNLLSSLAKANFLPYGIDFPDGPTGRFTNGRTAVDLISEHLGLEYIQPLWRVLGKDALKGVNYASGSSGILNETGTGVGERIPIDEQLANHRNVIHRISTLLGNDDAKTADHLSQCLYSVYAGSNDYMLNYFMTNTALSLIGLDQQPGALDNFTQTLVTRYTQQLKTLYEYGARKVVIFGLGPLGCLPILLNQVGGGCSEPINNALNLFNRNMSRLVDEFNTNLSGANFTLVDTMNIFSPDLSNLGLNVTNVPCCGVGEMLFCLPQALTCSDRNAYAYWDNAHPTEAANKLLARRAYKAEDPADAYPMDISRLVGGDATTTTSKGGEHTPQATPDTIQGGGQTSSATNKSKRSVLFIFFIFGAVVQL